MASFPIATAVAQILNQRGIKKDLSAAQNELSAIEGRGVESTVSPELLNAYNTAVQQYKSAQEAARTGYTQEEWAAINQGIAQQNTAQRINALEMGGGGAAINSALKANSINANIAAAAQSAQLKLAKQQMANAQFGNVANSASAINLTNQADVDRYRGDLSAIGKAISDLRMQKYKNREGIGITFDTLLTAPLQGIGEAIKQSGAGTPKQSGSQNVPETGDSDVNVTSETTNGFDDFGTLIG